MRLWTGARHEPHRPGGRRTARGFDRRHPAAPEAARKNSRLGHSPPCFPTRREVRHTPAPEPGAAASHTTPAERAAEEPTPPPPWCPHQTALGSSRKTRSSRRTFPKAVPHVGSAPDSSNSGRAGLPHAFPANTSKTPPREARPARPPSGRAGPPPDSRYRTTTPAPGAAAAASPSPGGRRPPRSKGRPGELPVPGAGADPSAWCRGWPPAQRGSDAPAGRKTETAPRFPARSP